MRTRLRMSHFSSTFSSHRSSDYGPRYLISAKAATGMVGANFVLVLALWYLMEGDLSYMPRWVSKRVLAQTQITEEDKAAALRGETVGERR